MPQDKVQNILGKNFAALSEKEKIPENLISESSASSLEEFNRLIASWQAIVQTELKPDVETATNEDGLISKIEGAANRVLLTFAEQSKSSQIPGIDPQYESFNYSVFLIDKRCRIQDANSFALQAFEAGNGDPLSRLPIALDNGKNIEQIIKQVIGAHTDLERVSFCQAYNTHDDRKLTLVVIQSISPERKSPLAMLMIIDTTWNEMAGDLVATNFGLTDTEVQILQSFIKGKTLKEIADERQRSYATIRNQFQSLLDKTGSASQVELLRLFLNVTFLITEISPIKKTNDPNVKNLEVMRPQGRYVDVLLYGDLKGTPIISLPSLFGHSTTPEINQKLADNGFLFVGIMRPGFGKSSPAPEGQNLYECLAGDICAVLDALEVEKCQFIGRASAARSVFSLMRLIPERIEKAVVINSMVPRRFIREKSVTSKWTISLMSASQFSPTIATLILGAGSKLMKTIGAKRFIKNMYERSPSDQKAVENPEVSESIINGVHATLNQGLQAGARDMLDGFHDWSDEVISCQAPVTLIHGHEDPHVPIDAVQKFAGAFPDQVHLIEIEEGGGLLNYTAIDSIITELQSGIPVVELPLDRLKSKKGSS